LLASWEEPPVSHVVLFYRNSDLRCPIDPPRAHLPELRLSLYRTCAAAGHFGVHGHGSWVWARQSIAAATAELTSMIARYAVRPHNQGHAHSSSAVTGTD